MYTTETLVLRVLKYWMRQEKREKLLLIFPLNSFRIVTYEISNICDLNCVMNHLGSGAAIALVEHRLVDNDGRLYVLGGVADISPVAARAVQVLLFDEARRVLLTARISPLEVTRVSTSLVLFSARLEDNVRVFLWARS